MKTWNWKWIRRVVLILLIICIAASIIDEVMTIEIHGIGSFWSTAKLNKEQYPLDDATVKLSFATYRIFKSDRDSSYNLRDYDSLVCLALYYCSIDGFDNPITNVEIDDYTNIDGQHFIKAIPAEDFFTGYGVWPGIFNTVYQHSEKLTIPREILELYNGTMCIRMQAIYEKDGKQYLVGMENCIRIHYQIIDGQYVRFRL